MEKIRCLSNSWIKKQTKKKSLCLETEDVSSFYTRNERVVYFSYLIRFIVLETSQISESRSPKELTDQI